jgi:uncharacterized membrane protein
MSAQRQHRIPTGPHSQFWLVPVMFAVGAVGLGFGMIALERTFPGVTAPFLFRGPPSGARSSLDSIVTAMR